MGKDKERFVELGDVRPPSSEYDEKFQNETETPEVENAQDTKKEEDDEH